MITLLGFFASLWVIAAYAFLTRTGNIRPMHWANAVGCIPIAIGEVLISAWIPMILTMFFGLVGWWGVLRGKAHR